MTLFGDPALWLPMVFAGLMGLAILVYVVLDGYDLGVGILLGGADEAQKDTMVASIGPFWDANETWLVLAIGILLVAFPAAHGMILTRLYIPVFILLIGLVMRGVAFEFRMKVPPPRKALWNRVFQIGSLMAALSQGYMLGIYVLGLREDLPAVIFGCLTACCLAAAYAYIGASWLVLKTEGELQVKAVRWARFGLIGAAIGMAAISIASPLASPRIAERWFDLPEFFYLLPLPVLSALLVVVLWRLLARLPLPGDRWSLAPFLCGVVLFTAAFLGLAYSFFPYVVPERLTITEAASAPESLMIILVGALFVLPVIIGYSAFAYHVFRGKATELTYH